MRLLLVRSFRQGREDTGPGLLGGSHLGERVFLAEKRVTRSGSPQVTEEIVRLQ